MYKQNNCNIDLLNGFMKYLSFNKNRHLKPLNKIE